MSIDLSSSNFTRISDKSNRVIPGGGTYAKTLTKKEGIKSYTHSPFVPKIILPLLSLLGIALKVQTKDGKTVYLSKASTINWLNGNADRLKQLQKKAKTEEIAALFKEVLSAERSVTIQGTQGPGQSLQTAPGELPYLATWSDLKEAMSKLGKNQQVEFSQDKKTYIAYVESSKYLTLKSKDDLNKWIRLDMTTYKVELGINGGSEIEWDRRLLAAIYQAMEAKSV